MGEAKQMLRYKFEDSFSYFKRKLHYNENKESKFGNSFLDINDKNSEWYLFQIKQHISSYKSIIDSSFKPAVNYNKSTFSFEERNIFVKLMTVFYNFINEWNKDIKVEREILYKKIYNIKNEIEKEKNSKKLRLLNRELLEYTFKLNDINSKTSYFVNSIINTRLFITDKVVKFYCDDADLTDLFKQEITENNYIYEEILKLEKTEKWWVLTTKEN